MRQTCTGTFVLALLVSAPNTAAGYPPIERAIVLSGGAGYALGSFEVGAPVATANGRIPLLVDLRARVR